MTNPAHPAHPHPADIGRLRDLPLDYLVGHKVARLLQPLGAPLHDRFLIRRLAEVTDQRSLVDTLRRVTLAVAEIEEGVEARAVEAAAALLPEDGGADLAPWRSAAGELLCAGIADAPHDPAEPLEHQLAMATEMLRTALAVDRFAPGLLSGKAVIELPAPLLVRPELPAEGGGPIVIVEIGDLDDYASAEGHAAARERLADLGDAVSWRWVHGPTGLREQSETAAGFAEIGREADPARFWEAIDLLYRSYARAETGRVREVPGVPAGSVDALLLALDERYQEPVRRDMVMVNVCAVPPVRPAFVIGRKPFLGEGAVEALRAEVERLRKG
jgi:hypothetical protein